MKKAFFVPCLMSMLFVAGCSSNGEEYVGTWSNQYVGGDYRISIERNNKIFLLTESIASNGAIVRRGTAKIIDGKLVSEYKSLFHILAYSKENDSVLPLNNEEPLPAFKRVTK